MISNTAAKVASSVPFRVAIVGGGVSGCASARRLAQLAPSATITLYEIGRGPGGRASTRKTRSMPHIYINHGAPYADISTKLGRSLISSLGPSCTAPFQGVRGSIDSATGLFSPGHGSRESEGGNADKSDYITGASGEMSQIASSLIRDIPSIETKYKTMIRDLSRAPNGEWQLRDKSEKLIGSADWLIIAGSGVAHPRWSNTFGGEPPLVAAEKKCQDPKLREALDSIATQKVSPVLAVFFSFSGSTARRWLSLDYDVADVEGSSILSKVIIQGDKDSDNGADDAWCSVVLHSTEDFALQNTGVYGASSSAARVAGAASDASLENSLIEKMMLALKGIPGMPEICIKSDDSNDTSSIPSSHYDYGPALHRWGNAFPKGDALSEELSFLQSSRIAFCGDYVASSEQARFGSFESALLSGTSAGEKIAKYHQSSASSIN